MRNLILVILLSVIWASPTHGETYKWVDEKGTVHYADDLSKIPEKYRPDAELRKDPKKISDPEVKEKPIIPSNSKASEPEEFSVDLLRAHELLLAEALLNGKVKRHFIVDSGASFTLINRGTARELGLTIDDRTPFIPVVTVSDVILTPLVTLKSIRVGNAEVENVEVLIYNMPSDRDGLLGNTFLNKFKVVLDPIHAKMTLLPMKGIPTPDRPGGYNKDYWSSQFRFYHQNLADLKKLKTMYENRRANTELNRVNHSIRYFENQLEELDRRASFAGVPRHWRE